jgi:enoyl-CoA hydratase/carnithine racemase
MDSPVFRFLHGIATFPKPLMAAVCGPAVGVGTTMLFHCDLVYAGDNAAFSMPFVNLGLCPEAASSLLVPQMLGYHRAAEALLMGEPFMAEAALEVGLVNRVVPPTEANAYAQAAGAQAGGQALSRPGRNQAPDEKGARRNLVAQQMAEEGASFGRMLGEPAAKEAFTAFMERRKPDFSQGLKGRACADSKAKPCSSPALARHWPGHCRARGRRWRQHRLWPRRWTPTPSCPARSTARRKR